MTKEELASIVKEKFTSATISEDADGMTIIHTGLAGKECNQMPAIALQIFGYDVHESDKGHIDIHTHLYF